jgi:ubiquinone/menaquinone biosynthesis C-methylase UbiE
MEVTFMTQIPDLLVCPKTKKRLFLPERGDLIKTDTRETSYPIVDGIINFCPDATDRITEAYDAVSSQYDAFLTNVSPLTRLYNKIVWNVRDEEYVTPLLEWLPDDFSGTLLDVPAGTGVFTAELYQKYPAATIIALDYSPGMLRQAQRCYERAELKNITFVRGDVHQLPLKDESIDLVLSMNGFHAFLNKEKALNEITRVLKKGGRLVGCFYIQGKRRFTDFFIRQIYARHGTFTPPFWSEAEVLEQLGRRFMFQRKVNQKAIFYFEAVKL